MGFTDNMGRALSGGNRTCSETHTQKKPKLNKHCYIGIGWTYLGAGEMARQLRAFPALERGSEIGS